MSTAVELLISIKHERFGYRPTSGGQRAARLVRRLMWQVIHSVGDAARSDYEKETPEIIADCILNEVECEMRHRAAEERRRLLEEPVGYGWLAEPGTGPQAGPLAEMDPMEKLRLFNMAARVSPAQCGTVIQLFRAKCGRCSFSVSGTSQIPSLMQEAISEGSPEFTFIPRGRPRPSTSLWLRPPGRPLSTRSARIFPQLQHSESLLTISSRIEDLAV